MQCRPFSEEYGGDRMSKMAQGVRALKQCMLPPLDGYSIVAGHGAVISLSLTSLAALAENEVKL